jgi:hypothetical protein
MRYNGALGAYGLEGLFIGEDMKYTVPVSPDQTGVLIYFPLVTVVFWR